MIPPSVGGVEPKHNDRKINIQYFYITMINMLSDNNDYMYQSDINVNKMFLCNYYHMNNFMLKILFYQQDPILKVLVPSHWLIKDPPTFYKNCDG